MDVFEITHSSEDYMIEEEVPLPPGPNTRNKATTGVKRVSVQKAGCVMTPVDLYIGTAEDVEAADAAVMPMHEMAQDVLGTTPQTMKQLENAAAAEAATDEQPVNVGPSSGTSYSSKALTDSQQLVPTAPEPGQAYARFSYYHNLIQARILKAGSDGHAGAAGEKLLLFCGPSSMFMSFILCA